MDVLGMEPVLFSEKSACISCDISYPEFTPASFSFNSPQGAFSTELQDKATSLLIHTGSEYRRSELLAAIVIELKRLVNKFERDGFADILNDEVTSIIVNASKDRTGS